MKKLRIGIAGLGRLGKVHAQNIAYKIPNAELVAACGSSCYTVTNAPSERKITA